MGRDRKEQLGVRVTQGVKARAQEAARLAGISLNEWVEGTIIEATGGIDAPPPEPVPGQISVYDVPVEVDPSLPPHTVEMVGPTARVTLTNVDQEKVAEYEQHMHEQIFDPPKGSATGSPKRPLAFDPGCRNKAYHFTNSPERPCRFCGGGA